MTRDQHLPPWGLSIFHSPFEDVLGDVSRGWGIPLNRVGVGLVSRFCYDYLDRTMTTRVGLLGLAAEFSNAVAIAIALVHDSIDDFIPRLSDLIESSRLWLLALVNGITLPAATPLSEAGAVHCVAFFMLLGEGLVHLVGQTIHNTLVFKLGVGNAAPFSSPIADTGTPHHVTQNIVAFVPLVSNAVHHPFVGCTYFFMGSHGTEPKTLFLIIVCCGATPFHAVSTPICSAVGVVSAIVEEGELAQSAIGITASCCHNRILLCTEGIFLFCIKVRGDGTPELSVTSSIRGARVVGLPLVDEGEHTGLTARVATVYWSWSIPLFTADSIAQTGTDHLLGSLVLNPAMADKV